MKRITLHIHPHFIVEDDANLFTLQDKISSFLMEIEGAESIGFTRSDESAVRFATCRVGPHQYAVESHVPDEKEPADICRGHWYSSAIEHAEAEHKPLFDEVKRLTELEGHIWQSGGMTMTIAIPLPDAVDGYPAYLGLQEGVEDDGRWNGNLGFYAEPDDDEGTLLFAGYGDEAKSPQEWAQLIATDYEARKVAS